MVASDAARGDFGVPSGTGDHLHDQARPWRREIVKARIELADEDLSSARRAELWQVVDCCEWSLKLLVADFPAELERIDREIEAALRR
jgi:hypothetical protein